MRGFYGVPLNAVSFIQTHPMQKRLAIFGYRVFTNFKTYHQITKPFLSIPTHSVNPRQNGVNYFRFLSTMSMHRRPVDPDDPSTLMKEDGVAVCSDMWIENFRESDKTVTNLTTYLRRFELWVLAYQKVCADEIGTFMPRSAIQRSALDDLLALRNAVLDSRFKWGTRLDFFIRSPKDKIDLETLSKRKIKAILTTTQPTAFQDRVVQEVLFMILEPIYEARFSQKSFAFRPGRTPHTVLRVIRRSFAGYLWYVKGDLSTILDGMNVGMVISALVRDVRDKKVIDLIKAALVTPVVTSRVDDADKIKKKKRKYQKRKVLAEDEPKPDPYWLQTFFGFAPEEAEKYPSWGHCGILSPLLANICLDELDHWMEDKMKEFYRPSKSDVIWNTPDGEEEQGNTSWPEFVPTSGPDKTRKIDYVRYGGHILIGVRGPRADAATLRKQLIEFCDQKYLLKLDNESLPIEHITKGIMFLDHVLCRRVVYPTLRYTATGGKIISEKGVGTLLSVTASLKQCIKQFRKLEFLKGDRDPDPQPCFRMFHATQAHTNAQMNKLLSTMVEWYRYADNRKKIVNFCSYIIRGSLAKLYAAKYKLRSRAKVYKIASRTLSRPLKEKKGVSPEYHNLLRMGLVDSIDGLQYTRMSLVPETDYTPFPSSWKPDHEKVLLEYTRLEDSKTLEEQRNCLKEHGLLSPQDYISMLVWNYKRNAIMVDQLSLEKISSSPGASNHPEEDSELRSVFVTNVHFRASKEALSAHFAKCGVIVKLIILSCPVTGVSEGSAYITFASKDSVEKALALSESSFWSRTLKVMRMTEVLPVVTPSPALTGTPSQSWFLQQPNGNLNFQRPYSSSHLQWRRDQQVNMDRSVPNSTQGGRLESSGSSIEQYGVDSHQMRSRFLAYVRTTQESQAAVGSLETLTAA